MIEKREEKFLIQLIESLKDAEAKLKIAYENGDIENFNSIKKFMIKIQKKISEVVR